MAFVVERSLFSNNHTLHNIDTGITTGVKADNTKRVNTMLMANVFSDIPLGKKRHI